MLINAVAKVENGFASVMVQKFTMLASKRTKRGRSTMQQARRRSCQNPQITSRRGRLNTGSSKEEDVERTSPTEIVDNTQFSDCRLIKKSCLLHQAEQADTAKNTWKACRLCKG